MLNFISIRVCLVFDLAEEVEPVRIENLRSSKLESAN
jgi:hypothetical protein